MQLLTGHHSPDNAYEIADYPHGARVVSQTTNPKRGDTWNKPKAGTYATFAQALYLDEQGHVKQSALSEYCSAAEARAWLDTYGPAVPEPWATLCRKFAAAKEAYEANRSEGDPLSTGLAEAHNAFRIA